MTSNSIVDLELHIIVTDRSALASCMANTCIPVSTDTIMLLSVCRLIVLITRTWGHWELVFSNSTVDPAFVLITKHYELPLTSCK